MVMQGGSTVVWETVGKIWQTVSVLQNALKNTGQVHSAGTWQVDRRVRSQCRVTQVLFLSAINANFVDFQLRELEKHRVDAQHSLEKTFCMKSFFCNRLDIPFYKLVVKNIFRFALFYEIVIRLACFLSHNACVTTPLKMSARPLSCHVPFAVDRLRELFYFRTTWSSFRVPAKLPRTRVML